MLAASSLRKAKGAWIGGSNLHDPLNTYTWTDGFNFGATLFEYYMELQRQPWAVGEPTGYNAVGNIPENCTSTSLANFAPPTMLEWNDAPCTSAKAFFCSVPVAGLLLRVTTTAPTPGPSTQLPSPLPNVAVVGTTAEPTTTGIVSINPLHLVTNPADCPMIPCARMCFGACGWSKRHGACVAGGRTSVAEIGEGVCPPPSNGSTTVAATSGTNVVSAALQSTTENPSPTTTSTDTTHTGSTSTSATTTTTVGPCLLSDDPGWTKYGKRCFMYVGDPELRNSFWAARSYCALRQGQLATVHSVAELEYLGELQKASGTKLHASWLGAVGNGTEFSWLDSNGFVIDGTGVWAPGEPSSREPGACLSTSRRMQLNEPVTLNDVMDCTKSRRFFCSISPTSTTSTTATVTSVTSITSSTLSTTTTTVTTITSRTATTATTSTSTLTTATSTTTTATIPSTCDALPGLRGWRRHRKSCVKFSMNVKDDFRGAEAQCSAMHPAAKLMRVPDRMTADLAGQLINEKGNPVPTWIGGTTRREGLPFTWWDGTAVDTSLFKPGEPNGLQAGGARQLCLIISDRDSFDEAITINDAGCSTKARFLCEVVVQTTRPTRAPTQPPTSSTQTPSTSSTATASGCAAIRCATECVGECGWSSRKDRCVAGGTTVPKELGSGDCPVSANVTSPTPELQCAATVCADNCQHPCGWSRKHGVCKLGGKTSEAERGLGDCSGDASANRSASGTIDCGAVACSNDCVGECGWSSFSNVCKPGAKTTPRELGLGQCSDVVGISADTNPDASAEAEAQDKAGLYAGAVNEEGQQCSDYAPNGTLWHDSDPDVNTCAVYVALRLCGHSGNARLSWMGLSADHACCGCGGGIWV